MKKISFFFVLLIVFQSCSSSSNQDTLQIEKIYNEWTLKYLMNNGKIIPPTVGHENDIVKFLENKKVVLKTGGNENVENWSYNPSDSTLLIFENNLSPIKSKIISLSDTLLVLLSNNTEGIPYYTYMYPISILNKSKKDECVPFNVTKKLDIGKFSMTLSFPFEPIDKSLLGGDLLIHSLEYDAADYTFENYIYGVRAFSLKNNEPLDKSKFNAMISGLTQHLVKNNQGVVLYNKESHFNGDLAIENRIEMFDSISNRKMIITNIFTLYKGSIVNIYVYSPNIDLNKPNNKTTNSMNFFFNSVKINN